MTKYCKLNEDPYISLFINCLIHILILFTILTVFFIVYISKLEKKTFQNEIGKVINEQFDNMNEADKNKIKPYLQQYDLSKAKELFSQPDTTISVNNKWLLNLAYTIITFLFLFTMILISCLYFSCKMCINIKEILIENIVIFSLVGVIEICFFLYIASQYIPVAPSVLTSTMIERLQKNFS